MGRQMNMPMIILQAFVNGEQRTVLLSEQWKHSMANEQTIEQINGTKSLIGRFNDYTKIRDAGSEIISICECINVMVKLGNVENHVPVKLIVNDVYIPADLTIGIDDLKRFGNIEFDYTKNRVKIGDEWLNSTHKLITS